MAQTISIMAKLIATFTFTAAFILSCGFKSDDQDEGVALLISKAALKAFVITDTIAMTSSITAAIIVFWSSSPRDHESSMDTPTFAIGLTWISLIAMTSICDWIVCCVAEDNMACYLGLCHWLCYCFLPLHICSSISCV
ncbi:hypothetical protein REPUB_Repub18cG0026900 [Reevesia pubescens]